VHGEQLVVGVRTHQVARGRRQFEPDQHGEKAADEKEERHRDQIENGDALVVLG